MKKKVEYKCVCGSAFFLYTNNPQDFPCRKCGRLLQPIKEDGQRKEYISLPPNPPQQSDPFSAMIETREHQYMFGEDRQKSLGEKSGFWTSIQKIFSLLLPTKGKISEEATKEYRELIPGITPRKHTSDSISETCEYDFTKMDNRSSEAKKQRDGVLSSLWKNIFPPKDNKRY